jgi:hypothetical protein
VADPDDLLSTPLPDLAHDALRVAVQQAIADLRATAVTVDQLQALSDQYRAAVAASIEDRQALWARLDALEAAVQALTPATP